MKLAIHMLVVVLIAGLLWAAWLRTPPLRGKSAAVPLPDELTPEQSLAQSVALANGRVQALTSGQRTEVFGVRQALDCGECRQIEIYNFDTDTAVIALVNLRRQVVTDVYAQPGVHPGINKRLADLALSIAFNAPEVIEALGYQPTTADMAPVDAALVGTACTSGHLCVSPTFNLGNRALWAMVDLTTEQLAGIAWTALAPEVGPALPPQQSSGCPPPGEVNRQGWQLDYATTGTDGLRVTNARYNGHLMMTSGKLLEWHVDYGVTGFQDVTGCGGGGGGFPIFPYGETQVNDLLDEMDQVVGFEVVQDFRMTNWGQNCNYRYEQHFQFWQDGRFRVASAAYGRGCGTQALYRPIVRLDIAAGGDDEHDTFAYWDGAQWVEPTHETYRVPYDEADHGPHFLTTNDVGWRVLDGNGAGFLITPSLGQFNDGGRSDNPLVYVTQYKPEEGDIDMGLIGLCCLDNHEHGPDKFIYGTSSQPQTPEPITNTNIVLWYVPQLPTDGTPGNYYCWTVSGEPNPETYPCFGGPLFTPIADKPIADFMVAQQPVMVGETALFTNTTIGAMPITYTWSFGDGYTSPLMHHTDG
jgi:hypothetical protein